MRLWLVTCADNFAAEYDDIEEMFRRGLTRLILDKRGRGVESRATFNDYERWLLGLPMDLRDRIWVRGTPDLAEQLDVRGCVCDAQSLLSDVPESWKRVNCIALCRQLDLLTKLPDWIAGAFVGPIFQPQSVYEKIETLGIDAVAAKLNEFSSQATDFSKAMHVPQVMIFGGVDHENLEDVKKLPLQGVSVLGGIWNYADPVNAFIKLHRALGG